MGPIPEKVGRYEIVLQIARGGMATVYLARAEGQGGIDRYVALKLTAEHLRDDPEFAAHLVDEAKLVAHLRQSNVVPVLDVGEDDMGAVFLVMEYIPGDSLAGLVRNGRKKGAPLPARVGLRVLVDALAGLHAAHEHSDENGRSHRIVHRDFSPHNILVGTDGIARLTDFGIAKAVSRASITVAGTMKGKVRYASPEQARGLELDRRCDVWAAGVIAWELLAGRKLYPSGGEQTLHEIVKGPPPRVRTVAPEVPQSLDDAIAHALQMNVDRRTPTAIDFARALTTGARAGALLADVDEVANYVQIAVAPILAERRETIARARRTPPSTGFEEMEDGGSLDDATVPLEHPPVHPGTEPLRPAFQKPSPQPLPSLPELPVMVVPPDEASTVSASDAARILAALAPAPTTSARTSATPAPLAESPFRASIADFKASTIDRVARFIAERPGLILGGASAIAVSLISFAVVVVVVSASRRPVPAATPPATPTVAPVPPTPAPVARPDVAELPPVQLSIAADAPIGRIRVGRRVIDVEVAAPSVAVELTPEEASATLPVAITSADGRTVTATARPGDPDLSVMFGNKPTRGRKKR